MLFSKIGFVPGKGTTTISQEYEFRDRDTQPGTIYYRLRQIDTNGMFEFSNKIKIEISVPEDFALAQNYPNPFNPETFIEFRLARPGRAILKIFDLTGREVRTIVDEPRPAGLYRIKWSGLNNQDELVSSGVYIYQLKAGQFKKSRKMLLLR